MTPARRPGQRGQTIGAGPGKDQGSFSLAPAPPAPVIHCCELCMEPLYARCALCDGPACALCDRCNGCRQIICGSCEADPDMVPHRFAGDRWPHPHNVD